MESESEPHIKEHRTFPECRAGVNIRGSIQYSDVKSEKNDRKNINAQLSTSSINMYINNAAPTHNIKESMAIKTTPRTPLLAI